MKLADTIKAEEDQISLVSSDTYFFVFTWGI